MLSSGVLGRVSVFFLTILTAFCGCILDEDSQNHPPVIESVAALSVSAEYPDSVIVVMVRAVDSDGDPLEYSWEANAGSFLDGAEGPLVFWVAPEDAGVCSLLVVVSDGEASVREYIEIPVLQPEDPVVVLDRCPGPRCPCDEGEMVYVFHGELGNLEPEDFYYSWALSCSTECPYVHPWTDWTLGITEVRYPCDVPGGVLYTFSVKCAVGWGGEIAAISDIDECMIMTRTGRSKCK